MTGRYKENRHGIMIGYSNIFFFRSEEGEHREFPAVVWAKGYVYDRFTWHLMTPAQQMIWERCEADIPMPGDCPIAYKNWEVAKPRDLTVAWLNEHAPGWALAPLRPDEFLTRAIFFSRVGHARAFVKHISDQLANLRIDRLE